MQSPPVILDKRKLEILNKTKKKKCCELFYELNTTLVETFG